MEKFVILSLLQWKEVSLSVTGGLRGKEPDFFKDFIQKASFIIAALENITSPPNNEKVYRDQKNWARVVKVISNN